MVTAQCVIKDIHCAELYCHSSMHTEVTLTLLVGTQVKVTEHCCIKGIKLYRIPTLHNE